MQALQSFQLQGVGIAFRASGDEELAAEFSRVARSEFALYGIAMMPVGDRETLAGMGVTYATHFMAVDLAPLRSSPAGFRMNYRVGRREPGGRRQLPGSIKCRFGISAEEAFRNAFHCLIRQMEENSLL